MTMATNSQAVSLDARLPGMMNVEKLTALREAKSDVDIGMDISELLARYEKVQTAVVCDVMREYCLMDQAFPGYLLALQPDRTVAGIAFTIKSAPNTIITGELAFRGRMLDDLHANAFVVWDTSGDHRATLWGGVMTATVSRKGIRGALVDGGIRDTQQILEKAFPVFYKFRSPNGALGRTMITHYQIPVQIGEVFVRPGDLILGDADGAVAVPRHLIVDVLLRAEQVIESEKKIFSWVNEGQTIEEITRKGGYF